MSNYWLALALSLSLPALTLACAVFLLRRAVRTAKTAWFSLAASGMVFTFSAVWLSNSARKLSLAYSGENDAVLQQWLDLNLYQGTPFALALMLVAGGFWARLAWQQRRGIK